MARPREEPTPAPEPERDLAADVDALADRLDALDALSAGVHAIVGGLGEIRNERDELARAASRAPRGLAAKLAAIQLEIEDVPRRGHADVRSAKATYSYDYILEADLMKAVRPLLAKYGVASFYSDTILSAPAAGNAATIVRVTLTLVDGDSGESRELTADGYAVDYGDKGANKAKTSAVRYILWKTFLQPSDEDPEQESANAGDAAQVRAARDAEGQRDRDRGEPRAARRPAAAVGGGHDVGRLRERITKLAVDLDTVQGRPAGTALGELVDALRADYNVGLGDLQSPALVMLGTALADLVEREKEAVDREGLAYTPATFKLPELDVA